MKKQRFFAMIGAAILMLGLAACGSWKESSASGSTTADRLNTNYANALPMESQLVLGTLELEGTEQAVDAATAAKLVPLYTLLEQMTSSGTSAKVEIDAVLEQIQATMTTDQLQAIAAMKLTTFDLMTYMGQSSPGSQTQTGTPGAVNSSGGDLPADPGGDGGAPPAGFRQWTRRCVGRSNRRFDRGRGVCSQPGSNRHPPGEGNRDARIWRERHADIADQSVDPGA